MEHGSLMAEHDALLGEYNARIKALGSLRIRERGESMIVAQRLLDEVRVALAAAATHKAAHGC